MYELCKDRSGFNRYLGNATRYFQELEETSWYSEKESHKNRNRVTNNLKISKNGNKFIDSTIS